jgi:hypothetical protein
MIDDESSDLTSNDKITFCSRDLPLEIMFRYSMWLPPNDDIVFFVLSAAFIIIVVILSPASPDFFSSRTRESPEDDRESDTRDMGSRRRLADPVAAEL